MKAKIMVLAGALAAMALLNGCGSKQVVKAGFLSDYSKLQKESNSSLRYVEEGAEDRYSAFIVEPVQIHYHPGSKAAGSVTSQQVVELTDYMHAKIVEAVKKAGKQVVDKPGQGVARLRVALTDMEKSSAVSLIPHASLLRAGIGGASMEAEVLDSVTGLQVGAVVESGKGSHIPFANLGDWTAAKSVMDGWAERFRKRLDGTL